MLLMLLTYKTYNDLWDDGNILIIEITVKVSAAQCVYVHMHNGLCRKSVDPKRILLSSRIQI